MAEQHTSTALRCCMLLDTDDKGKCTTESLVIPLPSLFMRVMYRWRTEVYLHSIHVPNLHDLMQPQAVTAKISAERMQ